MTLGSRKTAVLSGRASLRLGLRILEISGMYCGKATFAGRWVSRMEQPGTVFALFGITV